MFSVGFSADLVQIQMRETVCVVFLARIDILGEMQMMEELAEHVGMNYPETPDSRHVAQPIDDFLFLWEDWSVDNPITMEEDEGFFEPRTPVSEPLRQPPVLETRPALRSMRNWKKIWELSCSTALWFVINLIVFLCFLI